MNTRINDGVEALIEYLDEISQSSLLIEGDTYIDVTLQVGERRVPIIFPVHYKYFQDKTGKTGFYIEYNFNSLVRPEDMDLGETLLLMTRVFEDSIGNRLMEKGYQRFINYTYPNLYANKFA